MPNLESIKRHSTSLSNIAVLAMISLLASGCDKLPSFDKKHKCESISDEIAKRICVANQGNDRPTLYTEGQGEIIINGDKDDYKPSFNGISKDCGTIIINGNYHTSPCAKSEDKKTIEPNKK